MSGFVPNYTIYNDVREGYNDIGKGHNFSDSTANYLAQLGLMANQYEMSDQWWNEHDSPAAITEQLKALGYSDAFIAQVLSGGASSNLGVAPTASGGNGNGAMSNLNGAMSNVVGAADSVARSVEADTSAKVGQSQVVANQSQAVKNLAEAGVVGDVAHSNVVKNMSSAAKDVSDIERNTHLNRLTDEEVSQVAEQTNLTKEECRHYELQNQYYEEVTQQELNESRARCAEYFSRVKLNLASAAEKYSQIEVNESQIDLNQALEQESEARAHNVDVDTTGKDIQNKQMRYEFDYMVAHDGIKLDDDTQQRIDKLLDAGKVDEAERVCLGVYKYHAAVKYGNVSSEWRSPSPSISSDVKQNSEIDLPHFMFETFKSLPLGIYINPTGSFRGGFPAVKFPSPKSMKQTWNPNDRWDSYGNHWVNGKIVND